MTPIDVRDSDGTLAEVRGERFDGLFSQDKQLRRLIETQNEILQRQLACLQLLVQHSIPDGADLLADALAEFEFVL